MRENESRTTKLVPGLLSLCGINQNAYWLIKFWSYYYRWVAMFTFLPNGKWCAGILVGKKVLATTRQSTSFWNWLSHHEQKGNHFMTCHFETSHQFVISFNEQVCIWKGRLRTFWRKVILQSWQSPQECNWTSMKW